MVSVAAGCAAAGKIPFASTFGKFFVRAFDQVEMAIISGAALKLVGTHIGVTLAADGPSQMAIADVAFLRALAHAKDHRGNPACTILTPCDAASAYNMTLEMADWPSAVYLRAIRADVPPIYNDEETFPFGGYKVVKRASGHGKKIVIAACGYMVHTALAAAKKLAEDGIDAAVVDAYCLPVHTAELFRYIEEHGATVLTVEDNYVGGLGSELAEAAAKTGKITVHSLNVRNIPKSGKTPEDVLAYCHIAESDVIHAATAALK
jgi:transketolase